jgi:hypothetical protein
MNEPVITVTATLMDGQVVRWYRSVEDATIHRSVLSASRSRVGVSVEDLTDVSDEWIAAARAAHAELKASRSADLRRLATHGHRGPSNGPLVPASDEGAQS